jgi:beta-lactamase regulating signal transducer with metallopeptidase domain
VRSLALTLALAAIVTAVHRRVPPRLAAQYITAVLVAFAVAAVPTLVLFAVAFVAHAPLVGQHLWWCAHSLEHHAHLSMWVAGAAAAWLPIAAFRVARVVRQHHRLRCRHVGPMVVTPDVEPYAVTMPGPGGRIVVSQGLLHQLDEREAEVVLAHERAHAQHRHDRYLLLAEVVVAVLPPLRWLATRLQFSIERWADETAADVCHDRSFVARTLGKVALFGAPQPAGAAFAGLGVVDRMRMLLGPAPEAPGRNRRWALRSATMVTGGFAVHQLSLLTPLLHLICH